jgi:hypothetical protein
MAARGVEIQAHEQRSLDRGPRPKGGECGRAGGHYREVVLEGCGHGPVVERSVDVATLIQEQVESAKPVAG